MMKKTNFMYPALLFLGMFLLFACRTEKKKGPDTDAETEMTTSEDPIVLLENDYVRVAQVTLAPGEGQAPHEGGTRLIYALSDYNIDWQQGGEDLGKKMWSRGDVHTHKPGSHAAVNTGDSKAEWVVFERKTAELPTCEGLSLDKDVSAVGGEAVEVVYEDENFRVIEVALNPGDALPMHDGVNRVIYALSDYTINYGTDATEALEKRFNKGTAHWHEGCQHAIENTGDSEARFLVVAFK